MADSITLSPCRFGHQLPGHVISDADRSYLLCGRGVVMVGDVLHT